MIKRLQEIEIRKRLYQGKVLVLIGPRQVGKTTLLKELVGVEKEKVLWLNCDNPDDRLELEATTTTQLKSTIGGHNLVIREKNIFLGQWHQECHHQQFQLIGPEK